MWLGGELSQQHWSEHYTLGKHAQQLRCIEAWGSLRFADQRGLSRGDCSLDKEDWDATVHSRLLYTLREAPRGQRLLSCSANKEPRTFGKVRVQVRRCSHEYQSSKHNRTRGNESKLALDVSLHVRNCFLLESSLRSLDQVDSV